LELKLHWRSMMAITTCGERDETDHLGAGVRLYVN
jgi:hypothetical protein